MIRKALVLWRTQWYVMMEYRAEAVIWLLAAMAQPLVTLAVWWSVSADGAVGRYSQTDFVHYFLAMMISERLTRSWVTWELEEQIRTGSFSGQLVRPLNPLWMHLSQNLVYKALFGAILMVGVAALALVWPPARLPIEPLLLPAILLAQILALLIRFLICYVIGLLSFWTTQSLAIFNLYEMVTYFLGGRIAPLEVMPPFVGAVSRWLPFRAIVAFPVELMAGKVTSPAALVEGFGLQAFWLVAFIAIYRVTWRAGLKTYGAVGG